jgi:hypothetical protein
MPTTVDVGLQSATLVGALTSTAVAPVRKRSTSSLYLGSCHAVVSR